MEHWRKKGEEKRRTHTLLSRILPATIQNAKIEKERDGKKSACDLFFFFIGESLADAYGRVMCLLFFARPCVCTSPPLLPSLLSGMPNSSLKRAKWHHISKKGGWRTGHRRPPPPKKKGEGGRRDWHCMEAAEAEVGRYPLCCPFGACALIYT